MARCGAFFENLPDGPVNPGDLNDASRTKYDPKTKKTWYPTADPCTYCTASGGGGECFTAIVPSGEKPDNLDPRVTPLATFPRYPVSYYVVEHAGETWTRVLRRREYPNSPINRMWLPSWIDMASKWIDRASAKATTANRIAWVNRLKADLVKHDDKAPWPCVADCRPEMRRIWLVANAAQYLARAWGDRDVAPLLDVKNPTETAQDWLTRALIAAGLGIGIYIAYRVSR